ncbi:hypothetical protein [Sphingomonas sp.]|uniref:hypothetical protein n=1 Tax=Sphingomonas sp. TaxID=28214 RepID=UPI00286C0CB2|nr:hypothetical protein [Sphingomonas sp.]
MALPHPTTKQSVNLASPGLGKSRIRREPPPAVKAPVVVDPEERDQWTVVVGILAFALAMFVITVAFGSYSRWSPRQYIVQVGCDGQASEC